MITCSRCGAELCQKDEYCSVCGLYREGGRGRVSSNCENKPYESKISQLDHIDPDRMELPDIIKNNNIWKYYDLEELTQEKVDSELKRLHKEIEGLESTLIYMESNEKGHPDKMKFYEDRIRIRSQLDTLYDFLSCVKHERVTDFIKDTRLESTYGKLPEWRIEQLRKKKAYKYYYLVIRH